MNAAIFYASKYGSTAQYANWIAEASSLPAFDVKNNRVDPAMYDLLILGAPIIYYKLLNRKWIKANWWKIKDKSIILFTVSGAPAGDKLNGWIANSDLPSDFTAKMKHVALRGRQIPEELTWFDRIMLKIAGMNNPDPIARKEELNGFDYMDKSSIEQVVKMIEQFQSSEVAEVLKS